MKNALTAAAFVLGFFQSVNAQTTCLPCDQLGMTINVGSDTTALSIYHSGQYLTHPTRKQHIRLAHHRLPG